MESFDIKLVTDDKGMLEVARLRYEILHEEQQKEIHYTYHKARLVIDDLDDVSFILGCYDQGTLVGTARATLFSQAGVERLNTIYGQDILKLVPGATLANSAYASRLVVLKEYRHHAIPNLLMMRLMQYAYTKQIRFGFMSALDELIPLYQHFGAKKLMKGYFKDYQTDMNLMCADLHALTQILSKPSSAAVDKAS